MADNKFLDKYTVNIPETSFNGKKEKKDLVENLPNYTIKSNKKERENLSCNIDEVLYG